MLRNEIKNLSLILALLTSSLYVYGLTFHQGFLRFWGIEETMFALSLERTLFQGFVASSYFATKTIFPLFAFTLIFFMLMCLFTFLEKVLENKGWFGKISSWITISKEKDNAIPKRISNAGSMVIFSYWLIVGFR